MRTENKILIIVLSLVAPAVLIPVELLLPYPAFVEEAVRALVLGYFIISPLIQIKEQALWAGISGALFGMSESMLYLSTQLADNTAHLWWERLFATLPMHIIVAILFVLITQNKKSRMPIAYCITALLHYSFNAFFV